MAASSKTTRGNLARVQQHRPIEGRAISECVVREEPAERDSTTCNERLDHKGELQEGDVGNELVEGFEWTSFLCRRVGEIDAVGEPRRAIDSPLFASLFKDLASSSDSGPGATEMRQCFIVATRSGSPEQIQKKDRTVSESWLAVIVEEDALPGQARRILKM